MRRLRRAGLRVRLAAALAAVAIGSVALATVLSNAGVSSRLNDSAEARLGHSATHIAEVAAEIYAGEGAWTPAARRQLAHLAAVDDLRVEIGDRPAEGTLTATSTVVVRGRKVGTLIVRPADPVAFRDVDNALHERLNELHLLAGVLAALLAVVAAALVSMPLARPLQRLTEGARRMEQGDLATRVAPAGGAEIEQLAHALNRLAATLEREEELRQEATADLAHELRTPLSGIMSRIEAAQDGVLPDEAANLDAMHTEALRLSQLVADLGRLAEAQQPGLLLARTSVDLAAVAAARASAHAPAFADKKLALHVDARPSPVAGDPGRLAQVLDNLLSNALRYTDTGTVTVRTFTQGDEAVLEVSDTGIGLSGDELPHVFERFWRSEKSRSRSRGGAGIGLAIVRELVRAHDGRIDVRSHPGEGTTFTICMPTVHGQPAGR